MRRSERLSSQRTDPKAHKKTPVDTKQQLPSPVTHVSADDSGTLFKEGTATPPEGRPSQVLPRGEEAYSQLQAFSQGFSSPPQDTQAFPSQLIDSNEPYSKEVKDETKEGVWGYLFPMNTQYGGKCVVMKKRAACPMPDTVEDVVPKKKGKQALREEEVSYEETKKNGVPSGGYLIGRHPECGKWTLYNGAVLQPQLLRWHRYCGRRPQCFESPLLDLYREQSPWPCRNPRGSIQQWHLCERGDCRTEPATRTE